jgi:phosphatidylglycerol phospholipase C
VFSPGISLTTEIVDYDKIARQHSRLFLWTTWYFYSPVQLVLRRARKTALENAAGPFEVKAA